MPRTLIKDLQPNQFIEGVFAVQNNQLGQTKGGKPFIKCLLADRSGRTPARMWNVSEDLFRGLPTDGFVFIEGQTQPYQGQMQIIIQRIAPAEPTPAELADLLPTTPFDTDKMFDELSAIMDGLGNQHLRNLWTVYRDDKALMDRFKRAPAAQSLHHACLGGLLEHTLSLLRLARAVCPLYPALNADIVTFGLFLHDLGKCDELTWEKGFAYSDDGQLLGHIARGVILLDRKADHCDARGTPIPEPLLRVLHHIVLSHHGTPEFGALKVPATPEAIAVSLLDNLDAKLYMALLATRGHPSGADPLDPKPDELGGHFTEKVWALDTRLYRPDPTTL